MFSDCAILLSQDELCIWKLLSSPVKVLLLRSDYELASMHQSLHAGGWQLVILALVQQYRCQELCRSGFRDLFSRSEFISVPARKLRVLEEALRGSSLS